MIFVVSVCYLFIFLAESCTKIVVAHALYAPYISLNNPCRQDTVAQFLLVLP